MKLMDRLLRREAPPEITCTRCGTPAPPETTECSVCGWDLREVYKGR